ncbi:hypothetical protein [Mucilaginibacter sp. SP1R1]|uniref:hypothetical protein n=1 Tax=Mucilaginibacter sp. SP1R1 TaxID=2723091 RepID=UPI003B005B69
MAVFNEEEQQRIRRAIEEAENRSSGEIRVCIEKNAARMYLTGLPNTFSSLICTKQSCAMVY